jgi:HAD superfamily hydrolase (TIGR01459 family)
MPHSFQTIATKYDGFIIDLWGVVHDGTSLYPGAAETLAYLHAQKHPVVFLSNAPRVSAKVITRLTELGIPREHYIDAITSGQVAHDWLKSSNTFGQKYFYLGPGKDEDVLDGLVGYQRVNDMADADFVLNTGYQYDFQPDAEIAPLLKRLAADSRPFLCVNPDLEVVKQDGTEIGCAGKVAALYEAQGGTVTYIGKPYSRVYDACRKLLPKGRLLAIGDNILTDIRGGNEARIDTLLITGGVLKVMHKKILDVGEALAVCTQAGVTTNYVLPSFSLGE